MKLSKTILADNDNFNQNYAGTETTIVEGVALLDGTAYCKGNYAFSGNIDSRPGYMYTYKNGVKQATYSVSTASSAQYNLSISNVKAGDTIKFSGNGYNSSYPLEIKTVHSGISYPLLSDWFGGTPKGVKALGEFLIVHLYGINENGLYKGGIMTEKSTSATTGSVALGNAQGYIRVYFNGEYIKIPYYND